MTVFDKGLITLEGCAILFAILAIPLMLRKVPRNILYGYRTRRTLRDDDAWYGANAHFGRGLFIASIVSVIVVFVLSRTHLLSPQVFLPVAVVALVAPAAIAGLATAGYVRRAFGR
jgi:hypothetical protein